MRHVLFASMISFTVACGGSQPAADSPAEAPAEPAAADPSDAPAGETPAVSAPSTLAPQKPWAELGKDERVAHMKNVVVPHMKALFQASPEAEEFKDFNCATCHGAGAKEGTFAMTNPALPKLDPKDSFKVHMDKDPEMTNWMMQTVLPEMAKTLGTTPFDPNTNSGMQCGACHEIKK
jgi:mono/diheme cytochrome c family protein